MCMKRMGATIATTSKRSRITVPSITIREYLFMFSSASLLNILITAKNWWIRARREYRALAGNNWQTNLINQKLKKPIWARKLKLYKYYTGERLRWGGSWCYVLFSINQRRIVSWENLIHQYVNKVKATLKICGMLLTKWLNSLWNTIMNYCTVECLNANISISKWKEVTGYLRSGLVFAGHVLWV